MTIRRLIPARPRPMRRHGTAMIEFAALLPVLGLVVAFTFFFGWSMMHKTQVLTAVRYAAWHRIHDGSWPVETRVNEAVFSNKAAVLTVGHSWTPRDTPADLVGEVASLHGRAARVADEVVMERFPCGRQAHVRAGFETKQRIWQWFDRQIDHYHAREGIAWRRDEVNCWQILRDEFYSDLDDLMQNIPSPGSGMGQMIRGLYLAHW